jgi:hypothetical protein
MAENSLDKPLLSAYARGNSTATTVYGGGLYEVTLVNSDPTEQKSCYPHFRFHIVCTLAGLLFFCLLGVGVIASCSDDGEPQPTMTTSPRLPSPDFRIEPPSRNEVKLSFELSEEQKAITVYRIAPAKVADEDYAQSIAEKLGVIGELTKDNVGRGYDVKGPLGEVSVNNQNGFTFAGTGEQIVAAPITQVEKDELGQAAESFLSERGLLPAHATFSGVSWAGSVPATPDIGFVDERVSPATDGPFIKVGLDEDGKVARISYHWVDLEPVGDYPLVSEKEAFERIFRIGVNPAVSHWPVELDSVSLFFYGMETEENGTVLVPLYEFEDPEDQWIWVPALPDEYILPQNAGTPP